MSLSGDRSYTTQWKALLRERRTVMTNKYAQHISTTATPQSEKIFGSDQKQNNAGGYSFVLDKWGRLNRFLILGSEGNTYYATEHKMTVDNATAIIECIKEDGIRTINTIVEISHTGRAPKNDPAIFALALCAKYGDEATRAHAYINLSNVCRIATHLFQFLSVSEAIGKKVAGLGMKKSVQRWYNNKDLDNLALQVIKYRNREGFEHRDALRLAHVKTEEAARNEIYQWITWNKYKAGKDAPSAKKSKDAAKFADKHNQIVSWVNSHYDKDGKLVKEIHPLINAFEQAQKAKSASEIVELITKYKLPREAVPTELLNTIEVWDALLPHMPMTAMIRNLATMTKIGLLKPLSDASKIVMEKLDNEEAIKKARVHPIQILSALRTYGQGHGFRSDAVWTPVQQIVDALDGAFYLAFKNVEPTGKKIMLSLDVSGSMGGGEIAGVPGLTPRDASGALAMVTAKVEKQVYVNAFTSGNHRTMHFGYGAAITDLPISGKKRLDDVIHTISNLSFGGTDCALPMLHAIEKNLEVDAFVIYTDSETWAGDIHPTQALAQYRKKSGIPAKLIVVGLTATEFTIADPNDAGMMDVVGFSSDCPALMSDFIKG